jgi:hypothetical protein
MIAPEQIWAVIIAVIGLILTILNIADKVVTFSTRAKEPDKQRDERIAELEEKYNTLEHTVSEQFERYNDYISSNTARIDFMEQDFKKVNTIIIKSLQALIDNSISGDAIEALKESKREINSYLLNE